MHTYLLRAALAGLLTTAIFLFMRYLISPEELPEVDESESMEVRITREERDEQTRRNERKVPEEPLNTPPPPPPRLQQQQVALGEEGVDYNFEWEKPGSTGGHQMPMITDRRAMPIVRIPPRYPQRALMRNVEGWVLLEFTITASGTVEDIRVVEAEPPNVFDQESMRALRNWKYQPKLVNGRPVAQPGMRDIIVFEIKD